MPLSMLERIATAQLPIVFSDPDEIAAVEGLAAAGYIRMRSVDGESRRSGIEVTELTQIGADIATRFLPDSSRAELPIEKRRRKLQLLRLCLISAGTLGASLLVTRCA